MTSFNPRRLAAMAVLSLFALVAASCGSTATSTSSDSTAAESDPPAEEMGEMQEMDDSEMSDMSDDGASHEHGDEMLEVDAASAPSVAIEAFADPKSGHNVKITTTNFTVAPENASTEHVEGEGHMHLIIDGEKQLRFYNDWIHVDGLDEGEYTIEVELNANTHAPYAVDGEKVAASQVITVEEPGEHGHDEQEQEQVQFAAERGVLGVSFLDDPKGGWNFQVDTAEGFTFAPENASTEHVDGEGHLHWYIDGVRQGRLYGQWFYVADQGEGEHTITVGMSTNDHRDYAVGDMAVELDTVVGVAMEASADNDGDDEASADTLMVMVDYAGGKVTLDADGSSSDRIEAPLGSKVRLMITTDVAEHVHVHGYDLFVDLVPGDTAILDFVAEIPGLVEVELEDSGTFLFELSTK